MPRYIKYVVYIKYIMMQRHISITDEQNRFVEDNDLKLSQIVQKELQKRINDSKNTTTHHGEGTITYGDDD